MFSEIGRRRVAIPPARIATGKGREESIASRQYDLCSLEIETEADLVQPSGSHRKAQFLSVRSIKHKEATTACADELSPDCAPLDAEFLPFIDLRITHSARAALLVFPVLVHQFPEQDCIALFKRLLAPETERFDV